MCDTLCPITWPPRILCMLFIDLFLWDYAKTPDVGVTGRWPAWMNSKQRTLQSLRGCCGVYGPQSIIDWVSVSSHGNLTVKPTSVAVLFSASSPWEYPIRSLLVRSSIWTHTISRERLNAFSLNLIFTSFTETRRGISVYIQFGNFATSTWNSTCTNKQTQPFFAQVFRIHARRACVITVRLSIRQTTNSVTYKTRTEAKAS